MEVLRIADGLWRWTAPHPDWVPGGSGSAAWPERVGAVYYEAPDATVLIDPIVPADQDEAARFWRALDADVERRRLPVVVLLTIHWHERSAAAIRARYATVDGVPAGVERHPLDDPQEETVYFLPSYGTLVPGDILIGSDVPTGPAGGVQVCPPSWYDRDDADRAWYRDQAHDVIARLVHLPIERILVSHGTPVLRDGAAALRSALSQLPARRR